MSEVPNKRPASGLAITSLALGAITLLMMRIPIVPVGAGLLAVILGGIALSSARRGTAGGTGLAVFGIVCAVLGMLPTLWIVLLVALAIMGFPVIKTG
jgi:hypothetical protein